MACSHLFFGVNETILYFSMLVKKEGKGEGDATRKEGTAERIEQKTSFRITTHQCHLRNKDSITWAGRGILILVGNEK